MAEGMLLNGGYGEQLEASSAKRCKPDYECQIKSLREKQVKAHTLMASLMDYVGGSHRVGEKLAQMLGELVFEENQLNLSIARLVELQEQEE